MKRLLAFLIRLLSSVNHYGGFFVQQAVEFNLLSVKATSWSLLVALSLYHDFLHPFSFVDRLHIFFVRVFGQPRMNVCSFRIDAFAKAFYLLVHRPGNISGTNLIFVTFDIIPLHSTELSCCVVFPVFVLFRFSFLPLFVLREPR